MAGASEGDDLTLVRIDSAIETRDEPPVMARSGTVGKYDVIVDRVRYHIKRGEIKPIVLTTILRMRG